MRFNGFVRAIAVCAMATGLWAQSASNKQPKPKSNKEVEAFNSMLQAQDPDARLAAVEKLLTTFADTEFKPLALYLATATAEQKGDYEKIIIYGDRTLEADPKNYGVMLIMARAIASRTREFDLDKEEKLTRATKLADDALKVIPEGQKPRPDITDEQWEGAKKDFAGQAHEAKGMIAAVRKKYDDAIAEYKQAMEMSAQKDPTTMVRLATVYTDSGKYDDAIALCDQVSAIADAPPQVKQVASQTKAKAAMAKAQKK